MNSSVETQQAERAAVEYAAAQKLPTFLSSDSDLIRAMLCNAFLAGSSQGLQMASRIVEESR